MRLHPGRARRFRVSGLQVGGWLLVILAAGVSLSPAAPTDDVLDKLLSDLQITPGGDQSPPAFTLEALDGKPVTLAGLRGRAALLYFWDST